MTLAGTQARTAETDAFGSFSFVNLTANGNYSVQPKKLGYVFNEYVTTLTDLTGENAIVFTGDPLSFDISGRVRSSDGTGVAGVEVLLEGSENRTVLTDQQGYYSFTELPADGDYVVAPQTGQPSATPEQVEIAPLLGDVGNVDFVVNAQTSPPAAISGRVFDSFGRGLRGVVLTVENSNGAVVSTVTNSLGYYRFGSLVAGETYILSVSSRRYRFAGPTRIVNVSQDITNENFVASSP